MSPFPTPVDRIREAEAAARDAADLAVLRDARTAVTVALARVRCLDDVRHPDALWSIACLIETLEAELCNIDGTAMVCGRPLVLEDC
jgi:hypothetical protein